MKNEYCYMKSGLARKYGTYLERAIIVVINRWVRGMPWHVRMGVSRMMWMILHHAATAMMMPVAAHALSRLQGAVGGGGIAGTASMLR